MNLRLYEVDNDYVGELYRRDSKVEYHHGQHDRPYLGIVLDINKTKYFVPFSSPKAKHERMEDNYTFVKLMKRDNKILSVLNINNMIPVPKGKYRAIDFKTIKEQHYKYLLQDEYRAVRHKGIQIIRNARVVHKFVCEEPEKHPRMVKLSCDFLKLEKYCQQVQQQEEAKRSARVQEQLSNFVKENPDIKQPENKQEQKDQPRLN